MKTSNRNLSSKMSRFGLITTVFVVTALLFPAAVPAQDSNSINALRQMGKAFSAIAQNTSPAVVGVEVEKNLPQNHPEIRGFGEPFDPFGDDFFDYFFRRRSPQQRSPHRRQQQPPQKGMASGFIISSEGYILTNNHVVKDADKITVKLSDGREFIAEIIGTDPEFDIAVIKIKSSGLPTLELADSDNLEVGEWVLAIGNPFGLSHTVTAGIVSAKGRSDIGLATYEDFIQTDAAINPGNSGGPLLNLDGKVVGINTAIMGAHGNIGIGLVIPINAAKAIYEQLIESGTVARGFLGVSIQNLTPELAKFFGLKNIKGVLLPEISKDSAAEKAGLKKDDIVIEFNGNAVKKARALQSRVAMLKPGTKVEVVVLRDGKRKTFTVELGEKPKGKLAAEQSKILKRLGFSVQELTSELAEQLGYQGWAGVLISEVEPGSEAANEGLQAGMLIMEVNRVAVKDMDDFNGLMENAAQGQAVLLLVRDQYYAHFVALVLPEK